MRRLLPTVLLYCSSLLLPIQAQNLVASSLPAPRQGLVDMLLEYMQVRYPKVDVNGSVLYVSVQRQKLFHVVDGRLAGEYTISTARKGLGERMASNRTPTGLHRVSHKYGDGVPLGGVLRGRRYTGEHMRDVKAEEDVITSRILWLGGMEPGVNQGGTVDSQRRTIYIHGTADEASLGTPASMGCIRMRNHDVIALYTKVPLGTLVVILDN